MKEREWYIEGTLDYMAFKSQHQGFRAMTVTTNDSNIIIIMQ